MKAEIRFSLGFCKPGPTSHFGHTGSFGHPGAGGSFGFADPQTRIGYAYVTNLAWVRHCHLIREMWR
jgi:CubicO group peptidase (beta-lactamase class C family)